MNRGWLGVLAIVCVGCGGEDSNSVDKKGALGETCQVAADCEALADALTGVQYDHEVQCVPDLFSRNMCVFTCDGVHESQMHAVCTQLDGECAGGFSARQLCVPPQH